MQGIPTYLKLARNWLQVRWLNTLDPEGCISARAFHDYLLSINAPVLETVKYCQDAEWFDHRPWYDSRIDDYITGEYCLMRPVMGDDWPQALQPQAVAGGDPAAELRDGAGRGDGDDQDAYRELAEWAAAGNLKGKQRRMVERLAENNGRMPLADLNLACEWNGDEFGRCRQHANKRLRKAGWLIERHDNEARLRKTGRQK